MRKVIARELVKELIVEILEKCPEDGVPSPIEIIKNEKWDWRKLGQLDVLDFLGHISYPNEHYNDGLKRIVVSNEQRDQLRSLL